MQSILVTMSNTMGGREAGEGSTPKKRLKTRSPVWEHFTKVDVDGVTIAKCNYCNQNLSYTRGTTSHLRRHLSSCDKVPNGGIARPLKIAENNERAAMNQHPTIAFGEADINIGLTRGKIWEVQVKNAILADILFAPPNVKKAWSSLMEMDMEKEIWAYYQQEKERLFEQLQNLTSRVCLSIEIMEKTGWISIAAHFISDDFKLAKRLIGFKKFLPSLESYEAEFQFESCIYDWKLVHKIFSFTTNMDYLHDSLEEMISEILDENNETFFLPCFKEAIVKNYSINWRHKFFDETDNIFKIANDVERGLGGILFSEIAEEKGLPPMNADLSMLHPTDWLVKTHVWKFCCSVSKIIKEALLYKEVFYELSRREPSNMHPDCIRWTELEKAVNYIEAINKSIDLLSNFKYPTSNLYFQNFMKIRDCLDDAATFLKIFPVGPYNMNIFCVAGILDPRFKLRFFEYILSNEGSDFWLVKADTIRECFDQLFGIYAKEETNQAPPLSIGTANTQEGCPSSSFPNQGVSKIIDTYPLYMKELRTTKGEMNWYLSEEMVDVEDTNFDLLGWWKQNRSRYPVLSRMARDLLAVPACIYSVQESLGIDLSVLEGVNPELAEAVICSKDWILSDV